MIQKRAVWVVGAAVTAVIVLTLGRTLWTLYAVRTGVRFSVQLHSGKNEVELALSQGTYVYQVAREPNVGLVTIVRENNSNIVLRTTVSRGQEVVLPESGKQFQSFTISDAIGLPIKLTVHLESPNTEPVYLSFRRGL